MIEPVLSWLLQFGADKALSAAYGRAGDLLKEREAEIARAIGEWAEALPDNMRGNPRALLRDVDSLETEPVRFYRYAADDNLRLTTETIFEALYDLWATRRRSVPRNKAQPLFRAEAIDVGPYLFILAKELHSILRDSEHIPLVEVLDGHYSCQLIKCRVANTPFTTSHLLLAVLKCPPGNAPAQFDITKFLGDTETAIKKLAKTHGYRRSSGSCRVMADACSTALKLRLPRVTPLVLLEGIVRNPGTNVTMLLQHHGLEGATLLRQFENLSPLISLLD